ncbi:hypothetical protein AOLI_G00125350 [Acnodon oligacanthus]
MELVAADVSLCAIAKHLRDSSSFLSTQHVLAWFVIPAGWMRKSRASKQNHVIGTLWRTAEIESERRMLP